MTRQGHYYHEYAMTISVGRADTCAGDASEAAEEAISEALRGLARWLYRTLEREYEYL
ncbi:hypothetical protein [Sphingobium cloacae]|uniref:hypothetical protein n=1 Tax=Sphingobium cloacae TaxID=120107 RepID=UPI000A43E0BA